MAERKIRIRQLPDGRWAASASGWLDFYVMVVRDEGHEAAEDAGRAASLAEPVVTASTPWEASAGACEVSGEDLPVEWETLPWPTRRIAHGIAEGVTHILGASLEARRAIDAVNHQRLALDAGPVLPRCRDMLEGAAAAKQTWSALLWRDERAARRAAVYAEKAGRWLRGFGLGHRLLLAAIGNGFPLRRRSVRLLRRAARLMFAAARANGIQWEAPDTPRLPSM